MKFSVNRIDAQKAVHTAVQAVGRPNKEKETKEALTCIYCEADKRIGEIRFTCQNSIALMQTRIPNVRIEKPGASLLPAGLMEGILSKCAGSDVTVENTDGSCLEITSGEAKFFIATLNPQKYPLLSIQIPDSTIRVRGLPEIASHTLFAIQNNSESTLDTVRIEFTRDKSTAFSTDGYRLAFYETAGLADGELDFTIHKTCLRVLSGAVESEEELFAGIAGRQIVFFNSRLLYSSIAMTRNPLDARTLLRNVGEKAVCKAAVQAGEFRRALENAMALPNCTYLDLTANHDGIHLSSKVEKGYFNTSIAANGISRDCSIAFMYQPALIYPYLKTVKGELTMVWDKEGFLLMNTPDTQYLVLPLKSREKVKQKSKKTKKAA